MSDTRYRLVERLGQGGMATVWRGEDRALGRQVAIKVLLPFVAERPEAQGRFEREARALATVRHRNVLEVFDFVPGAPGDDGGEPARLVLELLSGPSLQRFVVDSGAMLPEVAALVGVEVAAGLAAVHARGIVHRDVKPENVLLDEGRVVLTDFGVARVAIAEQTALTQTGAVIGSPAYMSPEQARGDDIDARSDQFSLGSLIYWLTTGSAAFSGAHSLAIMSKLERAEFVPLGAKNPRVPAWLDRLVQRCLSREPSDRYADMDELAEALRRGLADDGISDATVELRDYFRDPPAYNAALVGRVVPVRLADARRALAARREARAYASAARVLQLDPTNVEAQALVDRLGRRSRSRVVSLAAGAVLAAVAVVLWTPHGTHAPHVAAIPAAPVPIAQPAVTPIHQLAPPPANPSPVNPSPVPHASQPHPHHAPVAVAPTLPTPTPPTPKDQPAPEAPAPAVVPTTARISVRTAPWCNLTVDEHAVGRTPQTLTLPAGAHHLHCENPSGARLDRTIDVVGGANQELEERLVADTLVVPHLARGDAFAIDDGAASKTQQKLASGRHRVTLYRAGSAIDTRWLDITATGCALFDNPELRCDHP